MRIFETPPLPPWGTAVPTTPPRYARWGTARIVNLIFAGIFIFHDVLGAVLRSTRNKKIKTKK